MAKKASTKKSVGIRPLNDKIIIRRDEAADRTDSGLYLPEQAKDTPKSGVILAVGDGQLNKETGERIALSVCPGDRVIFSAYAGTDVAVEDETYLVMDESDVLAVID